MQVGRNSNTAPRLETDTGDSKKEHPLKTTPSKPAANIPDFRFVNHFSICFLHPLTNAARAWVDEHIGQDNSYQPQYPSVLLEPRYCPEVLAALADAGFEVRS